MLTSVVKNLILMLGLKKAEPLVQIKTTTIIAHKSKFLSKNFDFEKGNTNQSVHLIFILNKHGNVLSVSLNACVYQN